MSTKTGWGTKGYLSWYMLMCFLMWVYSFSQKESKASGKFEKGDDWYCIVNREIKTSSTPL